MSEMHKCADCDAPDAQPQFTRAMKEVRGPKDREPKYYCTKHSRKHANVSPITGRPHGQEAA